MPIPAQEARSNTIDACPMIDPGDGCTEKAMRIDIKYELTPRFARRMYWEFVLRTQMRAITWTVVMSACAILVLRTPDFAMYGAFLLGFVSAWWYSWWAGARRTV